MSDEEKKAIDWFREDLAEEKENCEKYNDYKKQVIRRNERLLNLIKKQSKEIEELKTTKKELTERVLRLESDKFWDNVVSKDKIKAKIDYIKNRYNIEEDYVQYKTVVIMLQSLLEKE